jgi:hypothetical protein
MKKLLSMGLLTLCALTVSQQKAQAWVNAKFSVGLNWQLQSGNNNWLWGAWKNGQVPGPEAFGQGPVGPGMYAPGGMSQPAGQFPYFGAQPNPQPMPQAQSYFPETAPPALAQNAYNQAAPYYYSPYQTVSYQNAGGYYQPNYYSYPTYPQTYGQVPYYWYNNR